MGSEAKSQYTLPAPTVGRLAGAICRLKRIDGTNYVYPLRLDCCGSHLDLKRFRMIRIPSIAISSSTANPRVPMNNHPLPGS